MKDTLALKELQRIKGCLSPDAMLQIAKECGVKVEVVEKYFNPPVDKKGNALLDDLFILQRAIQLIHEANTKYESEQNS